MIAPNEADDTPAAALPKTPASTPQSPDTVTPAHQCKTCRTSFCQPLGCGHVYCNECLGSGNTSCPECGRGNEMPRKSLTPEPKVEHDADDESGEQYPRRSSRLFCVLLVMLIVNMASLALLIYTLASNSSLFSRLSAAQLA
ncbi:hypothetical protein LX36DRAFT_620823 [Colletotrichum falcatum]|nr:hypothetical protein LX36DRAFT_620823 [Colletotrichum falcatum]